jgi:hypothetical protein
MEWIAIIIVVITALLISTQKALGNASYLNLVKQIADWLRGKK